MGKNASSSFKFKQFEIHQDRCAMKVGTDGVLLGAWVNVADVKTALDIGTGTGLIALMIAQRGVMQIDAVEIDLEAVSQAKENVLNSPFSENIQVVLSDFIPFSKSNEGGYDLIVSNPPYFRDAYLSDTPNRSIARHTIHLDYSAIFAGSKKILNPQGRIALIFPYDTKEHVFEIAACQGFYPNRQKFIRPNADKPYKRCLVEFSQIEKPEEVSEMYIEENERHHYSPEYVSLTANFYLNID